MERVNDLVIDTTFTAFTMESSLSLIVMLFWCPLYIQIRVLFMDGRTFLHAPTESNNEYFTAS